MNSRHTTLLSLLPFLAVPILLSTIQVVASMATPTPAQLAAAPKAQATVTRVIDAATVEVDIAGQIFQVRYLGVEPPQPIGIEYVKSDVLYAGGATFNAGLVNGQQVILERDTSNVDSQGRLLRWVWKDGELANRAVVLNGLAYVNVTPPDSRYEDRLFSALDKARIEARGIWTTEEGDCATCAYLQAKAEGKSFE
ncbi:MAG: thermonuclease family protein [Chloroflexi bacterium]|nr:thermonuclease family protein [Chloroflexota bacterium]